MPEHEVLLKTVDAQLIASVRERIISDQDVVGPTMTGMFDKVEAYVRSQEVDLAGPGIALFHEGQFTDPDVKEEHIDVETAAPVKQPVPEGGRVTVRELPEATVAYAVHHGDFSGLPLAKQAVLAWVEENGYRRTGPIREVYLHFHSDRAANADSPHHVTEVQFPVEKD